MKVSMEAIIKAIEELDHRIKGDIEWCEEFTVHPMLDWLGSYREDLQKILEQLEQK